MSISGFMPSHRLPQLFFYCQMLLEASEALPTESDLSSAVSSISEHIEVDLDGEADIVHTGLGNGAYKCVDEVERQISRTRDGLSSAFEEMRGELLEIFEQYVIHNAREWKEPGDNDTQEHLEWHFHEDFLSISEHDWKGLEDVVAPHYILSVVLQHWDVERARQLSWLPRIEKIMAQAHASSEVFSRHMLSEKGFADPQWVDMMLPHLTKGYNSENTMGNLVARCATWHAANRNGAGFMSKSYHHWYKTLTGLGIEPKYNALLVSSLFDVSEKSQAAQDSSANQKLIMARFRRLLFLDPEASRKHFSLFAPGQPGPNQPPPMSISPSVEDDDFISKAMEAARWALSNQNSAPQSLGAKISSVLAALDSCFSNKGIFLETSYSELMHEMRSELEVGHKIKQKSLPPVSPKM